MFEEELKKLQKDMVEICNEYSKGLADKIFIYVGYEDLLNADFFYAINGKIYWRHKINDAGLDTEFDVSKDTQLKALRLLKANTEKIKELCDKYDEPMFTEMRITYEPKTKKFNAECKYENQFTDDMGLSHIVNAWFKEEKAKLESGASTDMAGSGKVEAANVSGWRAIEDEFLRVYPNQTNPKHYGAIIKRAFGGNDPLDGISIYDGGDFWHFVSFGMTELYEKESDVKETSGYGYELTFKLKKGFGDEEAEIRNVCGLLQTIARLVFDDGEVFRPDEYIYTGQTQGFDARQKSKLTGFITVKDPALETLDTPNGRVEFLELVGMTDAELKTLSTLDTVREIYKKLGSDITDYARDSVV